MFYQLNSSFIFTRTFILLFFQIFSKDDGTFMSFEKQKGVVVNVKFDHYRYSMHGTMISLINVMKASTLLYMK